jgi:hypothetical protein
MQLAGVIPKLSRPALHAVHANTVKEIPLYRKILQTIRTYGIVKEQVP